MKRKCIALTDGNYEHVNNLVQTKKAKNFSRAINNLIDKDKEGKDATENGNNSNQHKI